MLLLLICLFGFIVSAYGASVELDPFYKWRVVGGRDALVGEVPYIVSLQRGSHTCGGVIIDKHWILTASHCTQSGLIAVAGSNTLSPGGIPYPIDYYKRHELYGTNGYLYDIALLYTRNEINFIPERVEKINLCLQELGPVTCLLSGWGRLYATGPIPNNLQALPLQSLTHERCLDYWPSMVHISNVCTLTRAGEGACYGDSGGPLVTTEGRKCLLGLVNWGNPCANGRPDVFVKISYFVDWICRNTNSTEISGC